MAIPQEIQCAKTQQSRVPAVLGEQQEGYTMGLQAMWGVNVTQ